MNVTNNLFETKIQYDKISTDDGKQKRQTDVYLVDAVNFAEAESKTIEHSLPYITGTYQVSAIKRVNISEIFDFAIGDRYFKSRVNLVWIEENGKEKKLPNNMLIQADNIKEARERLEESMKGTMSDYEVVKIEETAILEVLGCEGKEE